MSTQPDIVQAVEIALSGISQFRDRLLSELDRTQEQALLEAFDEFGQHANRVHNQEELVALCEGIYEVVDAIPTVREFLPPQQPSRVISKRVSPELARRAKQKKMSRDVREKRLAGIRQGLYVVSGKNEGLKRTRDQADRKKTRSLSQIVQRVTFKIRKSAS